MKAGRLTSQPPVVATPGRLDAQPRAGLRITRCFYQHRDRQLDVSRQRRPSGPANAPRPVVPQCKNRYAVDVRRLVQDGVDSPLANWFVHVAVPPPPEADGAARTRSATEAFLTVGWKPCPKPQADSDLTASCQSLWMAGAGWKWTCLMPRHGWPLNWMVTNAWPMPRLIAAIGAKDILLQEQGYHVLRFLAHDVATRLDQMLDAILRALAHQQMAGGGHHL